MTALLRVLAVSRFLSDSAQQCSAPAMSVPGMFHVLLYRYDAGGTINSDRGVSCDEVCLAFDARCTLQVHTIV